MTFDIQTPPAGYSLDTLAQSAVSMERAAAATYCRLVDEMSRLHNPEAVQMFERLVEIELGYQAEIEEWIKSLGLELPSSTGAPDQVSDLEDEAAENLLLTPWQALNLAVGNEQAAFEYFSDFAANADDEEVRQHSENIASRKLEHIALLRLERKRAWRTDARARLEAIVGQDIPRTLENFKDTSDRLMGALRARYLDLGAVAETQAEPDAAILLRQLAAEISGSTDHAPEMAEASVAVKTADIFTTLRAALRETEAAFDAYMSVAARAEAEDIVDAAQTHASECVLRLEQLRDQLSGSINDLSET